VSIQGNNRINDRRIRERIDLPFGSPLNQEKLFEAKKALYKMGLFRTVEIIDTGTIPDTHFHNLLISLAELNAISFEFGPGFATLNREGIPLFNNNLVRGFVGFNHKNIDGEAKSLNFRASVQRRVPEAEITERKIIVGVRQPNIFYSEINTGANYINARTDKVEFDTDENTFVLNADRELTEKIKGTIHYTFEFIDTFNIVSATEDTGLLRLGSVSLTLERFDVDDRLNPRQGIINSVKVSWYNNYFVSEEEFYSTLARTDFLYRIYGNCNVHLSLRGGYQRTYGETLEVPIEKRFFLGGTGSIRGFKEDFVGTPVTFVDGEPIGGKIYTNYVVEFLFPIYKEFRGALFSDGGNLYASEDDFAVTNIRQSAGPGLRYDTPVGPIKADFGFKLDRQENEALGEFHFSIGFLW
jgi:outer membrane protein assembly factor BamA